MGDFWIVNFDNSWFDFIYMILIKILWKIILHVNWMLNAFNILAFDE